MYPTEEAENEFNGVLEEIGTGRVAIDDSLRLKLEALWLHPSLHRRANLTSLADPPVRSFICTVI